MLLVLCCIVLYSAMLCCIVLYSVVKCVVLYSVVRRRDKCIGSSDDLRVDT